MGSRKDNDDVFLIRRCLSGDARAWAEFYRRFSPLVRNVAGRQKQFSRQDVEDVTQDVFVKLTTALGNYDPAYSLPRFVRMVAERVCIDEYHKATAAKRYAATDPVDHHDCDEEGSRALASNTDHQEEELSQAELLHLLRRAMRSLGARCRELLRLRYVEELPYKEITTILDATENTLTVQARRCMDELRAIWEELVGEEIER